MVANVSYILPLTTIRRDRFLPVPGKVVVRRGQKVAATDTVAEANLSSPHLLLDAARGLGLPPRRANKQIQVREGDKVGEGDILAGPVGLTRRVVRSPKDGRVVLVGDGQILLEVQSNPYELKAGIPGVVAELVDGRGAQIETTGALIQGVWGNGGIDFGLMLVLAVTCEHVLTMDQLDVSMRGSVVFGGHVVSAEVFQMAAELPLRGLILGSILPTLIPVVSRLALPVILLEGFGNRPLNDNIFRLLSSHERREVAVKAEPWNRYEGTRPEVIIPLPASAQAFPPVQGLRFAEGQEVRVLSAPFLGKIGRIIDLRGLATLQNGVRTESAYVRFDDGTVVLFPLANLEIMQ